MQKGATYFPLHFSALACDLEASDKDFLSTLYKAWAALVSFKVLILLLSMFGLKIA